MNEQWCELGGACRERSGLLSAPLAFSAPKRLCGPALRPLLSPQSERSCSSLHLHGSPASISAPPLPCMPSYLRLPFSGLIGSAWSPQPHSSSNSHGSLLQLAAECGMVPLPALPPPKGPTPSRSCCVGGWGAGAPQTPGGGGTPGVMIPLFPAFTNEPAISVSGLGSVWGNSRVLLIIHINPPFLPPLSPFPLFPVFCLPLRPPGRSSHTSTGPCLLLPRAPSPWKLRQLSSTKGGLGWHGGTRVQPGGASRMVLPGACCLPE